MSSGPNFVFGPHFVFGPNFVFSGLRDRISSSPEFRLRGRILSSNFVFGRNLSFASFQAISSSSSSEFELRGGDEMGTRFAVSMLV